MINGFHSSFAYFHLYLPFVHPVVYFIDVVPRHATFLLLLDVPDVLWVCHILTFTERAEPLELQPFEVLWYPVIHAKLVHVVGVAYSALVRLFGLIESAGLQFSAFRFPLHEFFRPLLLLVHEAFALVFRLTGADVPARLAEVALRDEGGEVFLAVAFGYVAGAALADGVGVVVGDGLLLLAGVEVEHAFGVLAGGELAKAHGLVAGRRGVLAFANLYGRTPATKRIRRKIIIPEGVIHGQGDAFEGGVLGADAVVAGGAVLEVVAVAVLLELLPLGGHGGAGVDEVVL